MPRLSNQQDQDPVDEMKNYLKQYHAMLMFYGLIWIVYDCNISSRITKVELSNALTIHQPLQELRLRHAFSLYIEILKAASDGNQKLIISQAYMSYLIKSQNEREEQKKRGEHFY